MIAKHLSDVAKDENFSQQFKSAKKQLLELHPLRANSTWF